MTRFVLLTVLLGIALASGACAARLAPLPAPTPDAVAAQQQPAVTRISVDELAKILEGPRDFTLVNVHIPFEGNLPSTDLSIAYDKIDQHLAELPSKDAKIVLYCRSGRMSDIAARRLAELGYTHVYDVTGGMKAWEAGGRALVK